ncbi:hypothetical protein [Streptomyces sp. NPDC058665]|uniref:hypothetical protein n=1 Tax=Streptomyces sp. NPDC058665 TaxID=3346586 RepID=UPI0036554790
MGRTRGTWNTKGAWLAGTALAAVLALTGYVAFSGDDDGKDTPGSAGSSAGASTPPAADPGPTYAAPEDWTEPERWVALPRGKRTDESGSEVGFPRTTEGAVAMAAASNSTAIEGGSTAVDEQLRIYYSYLSAADQSSEAAEKVELRALQTDKTLARQMGVSPGGPLPSGAYVRSAVVGYQIIEESGSEVTVWLLSRVTQKNGESAKESGSYTRTLAGAQWTGGDWKVTGAATQQALRDTEGKARPEMGAPGDAAFNAAGWTAIREAS